MVASAVFLTDVSGKSIISRNYRGDVPLTKAIERFAKYLNNVDDEAKKPVFHVDVNGDVMAAEEVGGTGVGGETYVYVAVRMFSTTGYRKTMPTEPDRTEKHPLHQRPWHDRFRGLFCCFLQSFLPYIPRVSFVVHWAVFYIQRGDPRHGKHTTALANNRVFSFMTLHLCFSLSVCLCPFVSFVRGSSQCPFLLPSRSILLRTAQQPLPMCGDEKEFECGVDPYVPRQAHLGLQGLFR